ncbi:hypothetical protein F1559_000404 [Cyanidiococcus yangmingshanensis]|uniref:Protein kinase domain-containing protein n=1 Tax=Cyanidiococcus yangmingshanensis TaxID=2690220 RepID=A0A7J7IDK0_9RHOD|nr:hypothetical protein F1559_000404 [Cyanidiococcus yangmingshanensis]
MPLPASNGSVAAPSAITEGDARPVNELIATLDRMVVAGPHSKAIFGSEDGAATSKIAPGGGVATADQTAAAAAAAEAEARPNLVSDGAVMASSEERKTSYIGDPVANSENRVAEPASAMNREPLVLESARTAGDEAEVRSAYFMDEWYSALLHSRRLVALVSDSFFRSPQCGTLFSLAVCQACEFGPETFCMIYWRSADLPALAQCIPDRCVLDCREQNREALPRAVGDLAALHRRLERVENLRHEQHEGGLARQLWQQNRDVNTSALSRNRGPPESRRASFNETNSSDASGVSSASQPNADPWRFCSRGVGFQSRTLDQGQNPSRFVAAAKGALGTEPGTAALQRSLSTVHEAVTVDAVEIRATEMEYYGNAPLLFDSEWRAKWDIPYDELQLGSKLGSGAFGEVFMAEWRGLVVAVKQLTRDDDGFSLETVEDFQKEMVLLSRLRHPNIVPFCGTVTRPPHLCIVLGFVSGGSLYRLIHSRRSEDGPAFTLAEIAFLSLGIAQGMLYLHSQRPPVIHRDLKSPNVLIDGETGMPIVTDFGLSRSRVNTMLMTGAAGTPEWMAPEVMRHEAVDEKSDVWSYGVIVWELITGEKPWSNEHPIQVIYRVAQRGDRLYPPRETDEGLKSLLDGCFRRRSQQRPDFEDIVVFWEEFQRALGRRERNENTPTPRLQAVMDRRRSQLRRQRGGSSKPPSGTELDKKFPADDDDAAKREELRAALVEEI